MSDDKFQQEMADELNSKLIGSKKFRAEDFYSEQETAARMELALGNLLKMKPLKYKDRVKYKDRMRSK